MKPDDWNKPIHLIKDYENLWIKIEHKSGSETVRHSDIKNAFSDEILKKISAGKLFRFLFNFNQQGRKIEFCVRKQIYENNFAIIIFHCPYCNKKDATYHKNKIFFYCCRECFLTYAVDPNPEPA